MFPVFSFPYIAFSVWFPWESVWGNLAGIGHICCWSTCFLVAGREGEGYRKENSRFLKSCFLRDQIKFWKNRIIFDRAFWDKIRKVFFWRSSSQNLLFHAHFQMFFSFLLSSGHQAYILSSWHSTNGCLVSFVSLAESVKENLKVWRKMTFQGIWSLWPATYFGLTNLCWLRCMALGLQAVHWSSDPSACINCSNWSWDKKIFREPETSSP